MVSLENPKSKSSVKLRKFKCTKCFCVNAFLLDDPAVEGIMKNGFGLHPNIHTNPLCRCVCHSGNAAKKPKLITMVV